jgi:hypothetical protein
MKIKFLLGIKNIFFKPKITLRPDSNAPKVRANFTFLTKEDVENSRSKAYKYLL